MIQELEKRYRAKNIREDKDKARVFDTRQRKVEGKKALEKEWMNTMMVRCILRNGPISDYDWYN